MLKPRLQKFHEKIVCEDFILLYNFKNISQLPTFERAVINSTSNKFLLEKFSSLQCFSTIFLNTGQRPVNTRAHKSIALFNVRQGNLLGLKVTLRKNHLYNTLEKLLLFVVPKLLFDWRGVPTNQSLSLNNDFKLLENRNLVFPMHEIHRRCKAKRVVHRRFNTPYALASSTLRVFLASEMPAPSGNQRLTASMHHALLTPKVYAKCREDPLVHKMPISNKNLFPCTIYTGGVKQRQLKSNFVISSKSTTYFPEISELLLFFNSVTGFSFDCLISTPTLQNKPKYNNSINAKKKQFISAFQYPINKLSKS